MKKAPLRPPAIAFLAIVAWLASARVASADDAASPAAPAPAAVGVTWIDGWTAGRAAARAAGKPMLVYVRCTKPASPQCEALERDVFAKDVGAVIAAKAVPVRIEGGEAMTPEARAFVTRYDVRAYPTLRVMNADGHVVVPEVGPTFAEIVAALDDAPLREAEFAVLRKREDFAGKEALADALGKRMIWEEYLPFAKVAAETSKTPEAYLALGSVHARLSDLAAERAVLVKMSELFPDHEDRPTWRVRAATLEVEKVANARELEAALPAAIANLTKLLEEVTAAKDHPAMARTLLSLGRMARNGGKADEALSYFDKAFKAAPTSKFAASALFDGAIVLVRGGDVSAGKTVLEKLVKDFPKSEEARIAPPVIARCEEALKRGAK